jgi:DNA-binding IclR family transcriptional regulator
MAATVRSETASGQRTQRRRVAVRHASPHEGPPIIEPLARGLSILHAFAADDRWLGNKEIAARAELPTATANRLIKTLAELGYLHFSPGMRKYRLAPSVLGLGYFAVANSRIRVLAREYMQRFADHHNVLMTLGERDRLDIVILDICHSNSSLVTLRLETGAHVPVASTALGWALMSALPETEMNFLLTHIKKKEGARWDTIDRSIRRALTQIDKSKYCVSLGAWQSKVSTVSVPLVAADQSSVLVLGCVAPTPSLSAVRIRNEIGPALVKMSHELGFELAGSRSY